MKPLQFLRRGGLDLLKGLVAALAALLGVVAGGIVTPLLGLPTPAVPAQVSLQTIVALMFLSNVLAAIVLGEVFQRLSSVFWRRMLGIWLCNYLLMYLVNFLDALLFSPQAGMSTGVISNLFPSLAMALVIAAVWRPKAPARPAHRPAIWRLVAAWLAYPPIYYFVGRAIAPFVQPFYEDPSLNLGLVLPPLEQILAMQLPRGALFLLAVLPILLSWRGTRGGLWLVVGTVIFVQISAQTILQGYWLPWALRVPHALELLVDSFLQAGVYVLLLSQHQLGRRELLPARLAEHEALGTASP